MERHHLRLAGKSFFVLGLVLIAPIAFASLRGLESIFNRDPLIFAIPAIMAFGISITLVGHSTQ